MPAKKTTHETLASALAAAQGDMSNASKNAKNPHFRSTYADLASLRDAVIPVLAGHGIALVQLCDGDGQTVSVTTRLLFGAEQMDCGKLTIPITGARNPAQAAGSAITYARRYQLGAVAGVAATEDDDGNSLDGTRAAPFRRPSATRAEKFHSGRAREIMTTEIGCETKEHAEAVIRFATGCRLGVASLDTEGEEILAALKQAAKDGGGDWTGYLKSAVEAWEEQA